MGELHAEPQELSEKSEQFDEIPLYTEEALAAKKLGVTTQVSEMTPSSADNSGKATSHTDDPLAGKRDSLSNANPTHPHEFVEGSSQDVVSASGDDSAVPPVDHS